MQVVSFGLGHCDIAHPDAYDPRYAAKSGAIYLQLLLVCRLEFCFAVVCGTALLEVLHKSNSVARSPLTASTRSPT